MAGLRALVLGHEPVEHAECVANRGNIDTGVGIPHLNRLSLVEVNTPEFAPNPAPQPTSSRATRPDVPSTSHLPTDLQAVQPEARHTAAMEAIDFANFDAAVSTQC